MKASFNASNGSAVLSSHSSQRTPGFQAIQSLFVRIKHLAFCPQWTVKGFKNTVINQTLSSLHGESFEITFPVPIFSQPTGVYLGLIRVDIVQ